MAFTINAFIITNEALERVSDQKVVEEHLKQGKPLQELFGFSNEITVEFYEAAKSILEQRRFGDALKSFVFLTTLNPYISDFWLGLGMAQRMSHDYDAALFSYRVACSLDSRRIIPYMLAAQCCIEMHEYDKAIEFLDQAETYAKEHSQDELSVQLKKDAQVAKHYVESRRLK